MPNIEIHGWNTRLQPDIDLSNEMQLQIWAAIRSAPYYDDTRISYGSMHVAGQSNAPYLRIWSTNSRERDDLVRRLEPLDIDIELPPLLADFIPRKSQRKKAESQGWLKGLTMPGHAALDGINEIKPKDFDTRFGRTVPDRPIFKDVIE